jgi:hypothetical protein
VNDITDILNSYRESARSLWNNYLRPYADFDRVDAFAQICKLLFAELVLTPLQKNNEIRTSAGEPYSFLHVVPRADTVSIMVHRPSTDGNRYWDDPVQRVSQEGSTLLYIDYFDFDQMGYIDLQYYRVRIERFEGQPQVVGREALIEVQSAQVFFYEP